MAAAISYGSDVVVLGKVVVVDEGVSEVVVAESVGEVVVVAGAIVVDDGSPG
jgi:hypothetical protein